MTLYRSLGRIISSNIWDTNAILLLLLLLFFFVLGENEFFIWFPTAILSLYQCWAELEDDGSWNRRKEIKSGSTHKYIYTDDGDLMAGGITVWIQLDDLMSSDEIITRAGRVRLHPWVARDVVGRKTRHLRLKWEKRNEGKRWNSGLPAWRATIDFYLTSARKMLARLSHTETTTPRGGSSSSSSALFRGHKDGENVH